MRCIRKVEAFLLMLSIVRQGKAYRNENRASMVEEAVSD